MAMSALRTQETIHRLTGACHSDDAHALECNASQTCSSSDRRHSCRPQPVPALLAGMVAALSHLLTVALPAITMAAAAHLATLAFPAILHLRARTVALWVVQLVQASLAPQVRLVTLALQGVLPTILAPPMCPAAMEDHQASMDDVYNR